MIKIQDPEVRESIKSSARDLVVAGQHKIKETLGLEEATQHKIEVPIKDEEEIQKHEQEARDGQSAPDSTEIRETKEKTGAQKGETKFIDSDDEDDLGLYAKQAEKK